jgi:hypothetical protein
MRIRCAIFQFAHVFQTFLAKARKKKEQEKMDEMPRSIIRLKTEELTGGWRKLGNEQFRNSSSSPDILPSHGLCSIDSII